MLFIETEFNGESAKLIKKFVNEDITLLGIINLKRKQVIIFIVCSL